MQENYRKRPKGIVMYIGIDLGGTKIEGVVMDSQGKLCIRHRIETPTHNYDAIIDAIVSLVSFLENKIGNTCKIGIGTPGAISPATGMMKNSNTTVLNGRKLDLDLTRALGREIVMANDANCFALSEAINGAGEDAKVVFGVIIGTGTGGGIVIDKKLLQGAHAISGEWGHNPLPWPRLGEIPGPQCYCGHTGCIETFLSGPGFAQRFNETTGLTLNPPQIIEYAEKGDKKAELVLENYIDQLARGLSMIINILDPDIIVLGGGMSNVDRLYSDVPVRLKDYAFSDEIHTKILKAKHGDSSGVFGAAWLGR